MGADTFGVTLFIDGLAFDAILCLASTLATTDDGSEAEV